MAATETDAAHVARSYFEAIAAHDVEAAVALWEPGGREHVRGVADVRAPEGVRDFLAGMLGAIPDGRMEIVALTSQDDRCAVQWRLAGTFAGEPFLGFEPTGARIEMEGCDVLTVRDGRIVANDAYTDGMSFARQAGLMPEAGSRAEARLQRIANARTRMLHRMVASEPEEVADGVWLVRGGLPARTMNVFLIRDGDGVLVYDGGVRAMTQAVAAAGARLGGITRMVLGHGHPDHRGVASSLGVPVLCHPDDRADAESDGGVHYFDYSQLDIPARYVLPRLLRSLDGGPVEIAGTVSEGDEIAGFKVIHLPGHAPGQIGLWRESDGLALVSDCFYTLDVQTGRKGDGHPRVPHRAFTKDVEQARESIRKLAALEPKTAWPGHGDPVTGNVREQLELAAATT